jgi:murein DD-endopeptidase MepM/ murein hydrolase activator NlpD
MTAADRPMYIVMLSRLTSAAAAALVAVVVVSSPLAAQEAAPGDGSAATTTTTTTTAPASPATTTPPGDGATTTTTTVPDPAAEGDAPTEEVPPPDITVPPPPPPDPGALSEQALAEARARQASRVVFRNLVGAREQAAAAERDLAFARLHVTDVEAKLARLRADLRGLRGDHRRAITRMASAKETLSERAVWAYMRGGLHQMTSVLDARDPNEMYTRLGLVRSVLDADHDALVEYQDAREALGDDLVATTEQLAATEDELVAAEEAAAAAARRAEDSRYELAIVTAGSEIVIHGFVFPVADPHTFVDTFLAPRMPGTEYEHMHQGTDIFAPAGTPLLACERGVVTKMGNDVLGGIKLWLVGESGAAYYYAHLSSFAEGIEPGDVVDAGTVVGYVGNTGNAVGTPSHLHFEIHPRGGLAVNPYPLLKAVDETD